VGNPGRLTVKPLSDTQADAGASDTWIIYHEVLPVRKTQEVREARWLIIGMLSSDASSEVSGLPKQKRLLELTR